MRTKTALAAVAGALVAVPAAAQAATIAVAPGCYRATTAQAQPISISGSGFTPNSPVTITGGHGFSASATADAAGAFTAQGQTPYLGLVHPGTRKVTLSADDGQGQTAATAIDVAQYGVDLNPTSAKPRHRVTWRFAGFPANKAIYGHWRYHGHLRATKRMGKAHGVCGTLKAHSRFIEGRLSYGTWKVTFGNKRNLPGKDFYGFKVTVRKVFG
jgi:hypothetical protein